MSSLRPVKTVTWTRAGMELPVRGDGADALVPFNYEQFAPCQDLTTLAWLHPHIRDRHVRFESEKHQYFVRGMRTRGSVTGMIHLFARAFDADAVLHTMMKSDRWPRPNYLRPVMTDAVLKRVRQVDPELLLALLDVPRNDPWICRRVQSLQADFPDLPHSLSLGPQEIKNMWETNGRDAAACGTYMHYLFEAHINGYSVPQTSPEFLMLEKFLHGMQGWRAYRTEWVIYAEEENLAGSIDFCAIDERGTLALIDWKRSASLETKYSSPCAMRPPLDHLPDCAGWHYRLQLNAYRYIIEKYYGLVVSKMLIVGAHPDRQLAPFIDDVPRMEGEIEEAMKIWAMEAAQDARGGAECALTSTSDVAVELKVCSALNAEPILYCSLSLVEAQTMSLVHIVRTEVSHVCGVPYFGVDILNGADILNDAASWEQSGRPSCVSIVRKPFTLAETENLFAAIEQENLECIRECLREGQDPNCVLQESALTHAVVHNNASAVEVLLQAGAVCNFIPPGKPHGASHIAAYQRSPDCLELLLLAQGDPNFPDRAGMLPIHHAMCLATARQTETVELLIRWGAEVLKKDGDGDSAFSLAPSGRCVALCMDHCWPHLAMLDLIQRHIEDIVALVPCSALWRTCKSMRKQGAFYFRDAAGGSNTNRIAETTQCGLQLNAYRNIIDKYYAYKISKMFIVDTYPGGQLDLFIDEVPRMEAEMKAKDVLGAASFSSVSNALSTPAAAVPLLLCHLNTSDSVDLNRRITEVEGLCRAYVILLTNLPKFWYRIPSPFLDVPDADWTSGLLLVWGEFQTTLAVKGIRGADLADTSRVCKRIDAYAVHLRKFATEILQNPTSLHLLPNPCDASVPKREWERCLLLLRGFWRGDSISPMILLHIHSGPLVHFGCSRELWQTCRALRRGSEILKLFVQDVCDDVVGGSSMNQETPATVDAGDEQQDEFPDLTPMLDEQKEELEPEVKAEPEEGADEENMEEEDPDPTTAAVKRRRLMKGAQTTAEDFHKLFHSFEEVNQARLNNAEKESRSDVFNILNRVDQLRSSVRNRFQFWSDYMVRLGAAAVAAYKARLGDRMFLGDNAFYLWLVEGESFIRVHNGFCYIYNDNGAFLPYSGIPPQAVLVRLATFFAHLEGLFRRMSPGVVRQDNAILDAIRADLAGFDNEESYLLACQEAAVWQKTLPNLDVAHAEPDEDEELEEAGKRNKFAEDWTVAIAKKIWKVCQCIRNDLMHEKLVSLLVEWCETPHAQRPCVSYEDTCVQYDVSREVHVKHIAKSAENDCYVYIPHPLVDPVLAHVQARLQKFYSQTFWANNAVFECCLSAMALAKRGFNVDRCFIGESPGGVGQSLFSLHIDAMLGPNHGYFDPNVWYNEDELRKQVESFARCIVITGQEAPESHKKLHLDLFKKTMSGDGIAGRKPYGYTTRMFNVTGWKRLEVNRMLVFAGITKTNFMSVMRRALVWKPKARFHSETVLNQAHADHELDGHFLADPTLKVFLTSSAASAAGLRIQHAFELQHSQADCMQIIEDYVSGGDDFLTEDKMRKACGLSLRARHLETGDGGVGLLHVSDSQEERDAKDAQYKSLFTWLFEHLLSKGLSDITQWEFKRTAAAIEEKPNTTPSVMFEELQARGLMQKGCRKGKSKDVLQPILTCEKQLGDIIDVKPCDQRRKNVFQETMDVQEMCKYLESNGSRMSNVETFKLFLEKSLAKEKAEIKGRLRQQDHVKRQEIQDKLRKIGQYEKACRHFASLASAPSQASPMRRSRCKAAPQAPPNFVAAKVEYKYSESRSIRCRRYAVGTSAQKCARRIQARLFRHTVDLDIQNCCASLTLQLLQKLKPQPPMPQKALEALQGWVADRQSLCETELKLTEPEGKKLVTEILSGATPPTSDNQPEILKHFHQASIYLRWLACSVLQADYGDLEQRSDKPFPGATTFFYMWAAVEDYIVEKWCDLIESKSPSHVSLHFDGVRVNQDVVSDVPALLRECEDHIRQTTGFVVSIKRKQHAHFLELLAGTVDANVIEAIPAELLSGANCIPCALWHLCPGAVQEKVIEMVSDVQSSQNAYAQERGHRTYKQCLEVLGLHTQPCTHWSPRNEGKFLFHSENDGNPHCVALEVVGDNAVVIDGSSHRKLGVLLLESLILKATDVSTMVFFRLCEDAKELGPSTSLLDLQAGASNSETDSSDSCDEAQLLIDDEGEVFFQDTLRDSLAEEVASFLQELDNNNIRRLDAMFRCPFCPFRSFQRLHQLRNHIVVHHSNRKQYVCSGTKQVRVILALHDADCMHRECNLEYLYRSACLLRKHVVPQLNASRTYIDKEIRLLLTSSGPTYCNKAALGHDIVARRVLNLYYDRGFAEVLYRELLIHHSNVKSVWPRLFVISREQGNPLGNLYPTHTRHWWPIVEDVFMSSAIQSLRSSLVQALEHNAEYLCVSADATLKVCMTLKGQASYRAKAEVRNSACFGDAEAFRRLLTVRGRTGAVLALVPIPSEKDEYVAQAFRSALSDNALNQIQFLCTDSPTFKLYKRMKELCPQLSCLCLDPIHLAIVYEYAQWGKRTQGSKCLRALLRKVAVIDPQKSAASWGPFFEGKDPPQLTREEEKARSLILDGMSAAAADRILASVDPQAPLFCRITFIEALAAICAKYQAEVSRKVTGTSKEVRKVLWSACAPDRLEYLMNNLRVRHSMDAHMRALLPTGTTSNEALHAEINAWSRQIQGLHRSTLLLKLPILQLGKLLSHNVALCHPPLRQTRDNMILARASCAPTWTVTSWASFCSMQQQKAALPLHQQRVAEARAVREHAVAMKVVRRCLPPTGTTLDSVLTRKGCFEKPQAMDSWIPASRLAAMPTGKSGPLDALTEKDIPNATIVPPDFTHSTASSEVASWQPWRQSRNYYWEPWGERKRHRSEKRERCRVVVRNCEQDVAALLSRLKYYGEIAHSIQIGNDVFVRYDSAGSAASAVKAMDVVEWDG
eukprot:s1987_g4.t1